MALFSRARKGFGGGQSQLREGTALELLHRDEPRGHTRKLWDALTARGGFTRWQPLGNEGLGNCWFPLWELPFHPR